MKQHLASLLAAPIFLVSCVSQLPKNAITVDRLSQLERSPTLSARSIEISISLHENDKVTAMPSVITMVGQPAKTVVEREFIYPTKFDLAASTPPKGDKSFPVTPSTPTAFEMRALGPQIEITPRIRGPFIELTGKFTRTSHSGFGRGAGEAFSPIVDSTGRILLTENKVPLPHFTTEEFRVHAVGLPGTEQVITFEGLQLHFTCRVVR